MNQKGNRETITFSCEQGFKNLINTKVKEFGYQNTSQMIRDALQSFFESEEVLNNITASDTDITVTISVVYDHYDQKTIQKFLEVQHHSNVVFSTHYHLKKGECLENLIISDSVNNIRILMKKLRTIEGMKYISFKVVSRA
ncbi:MAG: CopG family ribbon-helix-helix protein [Promethearchaeota archaeon]